MYFKSLILFVIFFSALIIACNGGEMEETKNQYRSIEEVPASAWNKLAEKKIYFGHQSVGYNIIDGIKDVIKERPEIKLKIIETTDVYDYRAGLFAHSRIGKNHEPVSKIDSFTHFMENGIGNTADIAFFKFCFVDVDSKTDIQNLFYRYSSAMSRLNKEYPKTTFVHLTVPLLKKEKTTLKSLIKRAIGKGSDFFNNAHNIARNEFNDMIKKKYSGKEPVFDLAGIESTKQDGTKETFSKNGKTYYSLAPEYAKDGGHLNEKGRKIVAEHLLLFLIKIAQIQN